MRGFEVLKQGISQRHSDYYFINSEGIGPMGGRGAAFSAISSFVYRPNSPSRCCSNHFSDGPWKVNARRFAVRETMPPRIIRPRFAAAVLNSFPAPTEQGRVTKNPLGSLWE